MNAENMHNAPSRGQQMREYVSEPDQGWSLKEKFSSFLFIFKEPVSFEAFETRALDLGALDFPLLNWLVYLRTAAFWQRILKQVLLLKESAEIDW